MQTDRPKKVKDRKAKEPVTVPDTFVPKFWELDADRRQTRPRLIYNCIEELCEQCGADSLQKRMLVERAVFLHLQCQTIEIDSYTKSGGVDLKRIAIHAWCRLWRFSRHCAEVVTGLVVRVEVVGDKLSPVAQCRLTRFLATDSLVCGWKLFGNWGLRPVVAFLTSRQRRQEWRRVF